MPAVFRSLESDDGHKIPWACYIFQYLPRTKMINNQCKYETQTWDSFSITIEGKITIRYHLLESHLHLTWWKPETGFRWILNRLHMMLNYTIMFEGSRVIMHPNQSQINGTHFIVLKIYLIHVMTSTNFNKPLLGNDFLNQKVSCQKIRIVCISPLSYSLHQGKRSISWPKAKICLAKLALG